MLSLKLKRTQWLGIFLFVLAVVVGAEPLLRIAVYEITEFKTYEFFSLFLEVSSVVILGLFFILFGFRNVAFFFCNVAIPMISVFPAPNRSFRNIQLTGNLY